MEENEAHAQELERVNESSQTQLRSLQLELQNAMDKFTALVRDLL